MTKITYYRTEDAFEVRLDGHAGYAGYGNDIVCASLSTLIQTLAARMPSVTDRYDFNLESGSAWVRGMGAEAVKAFQTILTGFRGVQEAFPKYVSIAEAGCPILSKRNVKV
jgi:uncharacterized protein YsxB (DUF464 family)